MGLLAKSVSIFKPTRPAFATLNSTLQWNNWMNCNDTLCRISIGEKPVCTSARSVFHGAVTRDRGYRRTKGDAAPFLAVVAKTRDRKSTRLNSSHQIISYAVFCLKKKNSNSKLCAS